MAKIFNVNGACRPSWHYMVDLTSRLNEIKAMIDVGKYFAINRARQYGKTTVLHALADYLKHDYEVISLDFQVMGALSFQDEPTFVAAFSQELLDASPNIPEKIEKKLTDFVEGTATINSLQALFKVIKLWCKQSGKPLVLIVDEVDTAANNQVFLDFLAQLRAYYLKRPDTNTFQSVILSGVYDIRSIRRKLRPDEEHKQNSPWNISADFDVAMSFSPEDIAGMLNQYEADYHTGMDITKLSRLLFEYTSGYPVLVSRLCNLMDEKIPRMDNFKDKAAAWSKDGLLEAVKLLLSEKNALFDSLIGKLEDYPELKNLIRMLLFQGQTILYNADSPAINMLLMFGFAKVEQMCVQIANRIFEVRLYNYFLTLPVVQENKI